MIYVEQFKIYAPTYIFLPMLLDGTRLAWLDSIHFNSSFLSEIDKNLNIKIYTRSEIISIIQVMYYYVMYLSKSVC